MFLVGGGDLSNRGKMRNALLFKCFQIIFIHLNWANSSIVPDGIAKIMSEFPGREFIVFGDLPVEGDGSISSLVEANANFKFVSERVSSLALYIGILLAYFGITSG